MKEEIRRELIEIVSAIKMHLLYQRSLGAFAYGVDLFEEIIREKENLAKIERLTRASTPQKDEQIKKNVSYQKLSLFDKDSKDDFEPTKKIALSREDKIRLLEELMSEIGPDCNRCRLGGLGRSKVVFGEGNVDARIMFIGEGPGEDEDIQGLPFVGKAGQLLTRIIKAMGLVREEVYIANVVKCRPPENRTPLPDEMDICGNFLRRQIRIVSPEIIIALGGTAASYLLGDYKIKISQVRSRQLEYRDGEIVIPLVATFHPSYVLRRGETPEVKREVWKDITLAMNIIGMEVKK